MVGGGWKYLRSGTDERLFRLSPETDERQDLTTTDSEVSSVMLSHLRRELANHPLEVIAPSEINEELLETLEALGYLDN